MTTKHMTVKQLEAEITKLENKIDKEIDALHLLLDKGNDLVGEAFTLEDELFELRDTFEMKTRFAKPETKGDNMKGRKTKAAPPVPVDLTKYIQQFIGNERSKKTKVVPKKKTKTVPKKKKTTPKKRSKK